MKNKVFFRGLLLSGVAVAVAACGNLSEVSDDGNIENPVFPKISASDFNHDGSQFGSWPNWANVREVERGMNKDQLYNLLGRPHFTEGLYGVREWDYAFNYREDGVHKVCQFKIGFDKNMNAQSFFWYPNGCNGNSQFNLNADFLFDFDKDTLTAKGKEAVDSVANQLKESKAELVKIEGHTDRLGSVAYNLDLSKRRARTVENRLKQNGVTAEMKSAGLGEAYQVKACEGESGQALRDCLRPNRRVIISANGGVKQQQIAVSNVAGPNGPAPLYPAGK